MRPPGRGNLPGGTRERRFHMIVLTKRNHEKFLVNHLQIEHIECIPEVKITMMNHDYYLVRETVEDIIEKIAVYNAKVQDVHREIAVTDKR
jgi:flagellar protein FlbD